MEDDLNNLTPADNTDIDGNKVDIGGDTGVNEAAPVAPEPVESQGVAQDAERPEMTPDLNVNPGADLGATEAKNDQLPASEAQSAPVEPVSFIKNLLLKAREKIQFNKKKKLDKIIELARGKGKINNADVCKALHVSQATATNYFNELEKQGRLRQVGKTGHEVFYQLNG